MADLPIARILWAGNDSDHAGPSGHLHVEGQPNFRGTPPLSNPGMSQSVQIVYEAMRAEYGTPYYFQDPAPPAPSWSHMGWYNRRKIAGSNTWSQHAWANALDIGPLRTVAEQQEYYDFLTGAQTPTPPEEDVMFTKGYDEADWRKLWDAGVVSGNSWESFKAYWVTDAAKRTDEQHLQASGNIVITISGRLGSGGNAPHTHSASVTLS